MANHDYAQHLLEVARMMELAARTAPKSKGEDFVQIVTLSGQDIDKLADAMLDFGKKTNKANFDRDAADVRNSPVVVIIGLKAAKTAGLDCGACGFNTCAGLENAQRPKTEFSGPTCAFRLLDLGIALGSAAKTAQIFNADNRIMYRIGTAARFGKLIDWDIAIGIPLSATGKNIFFNRSR
jgi:uncharacterized ferredoxin-like protein